MFYHTLVSDWNHGNAHFLRGVATELISRGHDVTVYEPVESWSYRNLVQEHGQKPIRKFHAAYPQLQSVRYEFNPGDGRPSDTPLLNRLDLDVALDRAELVIVHEWNDHQLVRAIGEHRKRHSGYRLLFHDTHHRMVTEPASMAAYDLSNYDGVLAYGNVLKELYQSRQMARRVWTWHEAADIRIFHPLDDRPREGDLVWIGNWGDDERNAELMEFLVRPIQELGLKARLYGVRYPEHARQALASGTPGATAEAVQYSGWLPNFEAPEVFSRFAMTVHVPRRPYVKALPGIPTIRVFEALASGIPLICSPWNDVEKLFRPGTDFLVARDGAEMKQQMSALMSDPELGRSLVQHGLQTIRSRHTCAHRVDELLQIHRELSQP